MKSTVGLDNGAPAGSYTVKVQFIVDQDGNLSDFKTLTNNGYGMEAEILRVMKLSPRWNPGVQNGHIVKAYKMQPVTFVIEEDVETKNTQQEQKIPTVSISELKKATVGSLLQLEPGSDVKSFLFTIDNDVNDVIVVPNQGNKFNEKTKMLIQNAKPGKVFTVDKIITFENGVEKKRPSVIYKITD